MKRSSFGFAVWLLLLAVAAATWVFAAPQGQAQPPPPQQQSPPPPTTAAIPDAPSISLRKLTQAGDATVPGQKRPPAPKPLDGPSARFQLLFLQYRRADSDAAIEALSKWTEGELIAEAVSSPNDDVWTRAALVAFLTETGLRKGTFGYFSDYSPQWILDKGWGLDKMFEIYSYRSATIISDLTRIGRRTHDAALLSFCSRWYANTVSYSVRLRRPSLEGLQSIADHDLSDQPTVQLLLGSIYESRSGPFAITATHVCFLGLMISGPDGCAINPAGPRPPTPPSQEALYFLGHAVAQQPDLAEAHLRLGHMLHILGRTQEARPHFEEALRLALDQELGYVAYMASMYLGELEEHEGHYTRAAEYFRDAVAADPTAHIANVALGEALLLSGDRTGWLEARHMFDDESAEHPKKLDPWFFYRFAQYWHVAASLREMRQIVRQQQ
jgi:tetratricopeptide (TPR) repeat protein